MLCWQNKSWAKRKNTKWSIDLLRNGGLTWFNHGQASNDDEFKMIKLVEVMILVGFPIIRVTVSNLTQVSSGGWQDH